MFKGQDLKGYAPPSVVKFFNNNTARRFLWWVIFFLLSFMILSMNFLPDQEVLEEGAIAPRDVFYGGGTVTFTSEIKTEEARKNAAQGIPQIYRDDPQALSRITAEIKELFKKFQSIQNDQTLGADGQKVQIETLLGETLTTEQFKILIQGNDAALQGLEAGIIGIIELAMAEEVKEEQLEAVEKEISAEVAALNINDAFKVLLTGIVHQAKLEPNRVYDPVATAKEVELKIAQVEPVQVTVRSGEKLVEKGTVVTAGQIEALQFLGLQREGTSALIFVGLFGFVVITYGLLMYYIRSYKPIIQKQDSNIILIGLLLNVTLIIAKIIGSIHISDRPEIAAQVFYAIPIAACSMLVAILMDVRTASLITVLLSLYLGVMTNGQMVYSTVVIIGGLVAIYRVAGLTQRSQLVRVSIDIGFVSALTVIVFGLIWSQSPTVIGIGAAMGILNGILASIFTIGTLPFLESAFGITTSVKLLELSSPSHPLMKRLMMEAPGTYNHSILVGNLGEAAADAIGADSLLVRVGSYYHDIGKIKRPYFFTENQPAAENPHDKITPTLSTLIIISHVKDGIELAKEHKFPRLILDIIEQHHGNSLVSYFYHKAKEGDKGEGILESDFRYQAHKPQNKEVAIIMLADSVQAAVQAMDKPSKGSIETKVREIVKSKLDDGQLSDCDLTFRDIEAIIQAFLVVLNGMFHSRIEYPDQIAKEMEKGKLKNGVNHQESTRQDQPSAGNGKAAL
ncbi:HD family phosphohydrolase [Dehalobacterium formicoaceticum]|uniref:HDIG domain-containing protein n=1 Tax=Dehalobacterium formicoaceticum TaxID=51515 RepID=A0ABT1Y0E9_9FIRM|nr:HDIG domain-containing metalloprotein [Dehalobacterium formicoaceticum]MCR6544028.1 HDIG domain-containing protein [Dehalobacterium formicoaceticum]